MKKIMIVLLTISIVVIGINSVKAKNENPVLKISFINNDEMSLRYEKKENVNGEILKMYIDDNKNEYTLNQDNEVVGFYKKIEIDDEYLSNSVSEIKQKKLKASSYLENAKNTLATILNNNEYKNSSVIDDYYLMSANYTESYSEFNYTFAKKIDNYFVNDCIMISLDSSGCLTSFIAYQKGMFDNYKNISINKEDVDKFIKSEMFSKHNVEEYDVSQEIINYKDNRLVLEIMVGYKIDEAYSSDTLYYYL